MTASSAKLAAIENAITTRSRRDFLGLPSIASSDVSKSVASTLTAAALSTVATSAAYALSTDKTD